MESLALSKETYDKIVSRDYKGGTIRAFISYSSIDKVVAGSVKYLLQEYGFDVFLAHEDIKPTADWLEEIERNLRECDVFLPILSEEY